MFGDQGIFIDRKLFLQAGKFPVIPVMEDYQFSLTLKENGSPAGNGEKADLYIGSPLPKRYDTQIKINVENEPVKKNVPGSCSNRKDRRLYRDVR